MSSSVQKNIRAAQKYMKQKDYVRAETIYLEILKKFPKNINALNALKALKNINKNKSVDIHKNERLQELNKHFSLRKYKIVIEKAKELQKIYPNEINLYNIQGASNASMQMFEEAIKCYEKILKIEPDSSIAYYNIAIMYDSLKLPEKAIKNYKNAIKNKTDYADAYNNMGSAYVELGYINEAIGAYNKVLELIPNHAYAHNNLGNVYMLQRFYDKAIESFKKAIFFDQKYADAYNNLGDAYYSLDKITKAHNTYNKALSINPHHVKALINLGMIYYEHSDYKKAIGAFQKALKIEPKNEFAFACKLFNQRSVYEWEQSDKNELKISQLGLNKIKVSPLMLLALEDAPERHKLRAANFIKELTHIKPFPLSTKPKNKTEYIRLGYISSDFNAHAVAYLIVKVLESHNRKDFRVYGYSIGPKDNDEMNAKMKKTFDVYEDVNHLDSKEIASKIHADEIDILIDLNGYTKNCRASIFAYKPAKIQINFLGFPGTTGSNYMDYIIADDVVIPTKNDQFYSESIIRLPYTYLPTDNTRVISKKEITRKSMGLPKTGIVFCCFNNNHKISSNEFDIWMNIMSKVEGSVFWLRARNNLEKDNICIQASIRGINPSRIIFAGSLPIDEHLARYRLADIFLDTFNYNAHTTATEALWAGLPIITKIGKGFPARVASSVLKAIGLEELVTHSYKEYEELILHLALNPKSLLEIKNKLNKNRLSKPLFDTKNYTKYLEASYKQAFDIYIKGENVKNININKKNISIDI